MGNVDRWLIYALGSGWGHLNRAIALARVAPCPVEILVNSPYAATVQRTLADSHIRLQALPSASSPQSTCDYVQQWLMRASFTHLIVDTFPRGLVGDLAHILGTVTVPRCWVHRDLNPDYIAAKAIADFVSQHYEQVVVPGEAAAPLQHLANACQTAPWLLRDGAELLAVRNALRTRFQLDGSRPVLVVCATGQPDELRLFSDLARQLAQAFPACAVYCLAHHCSADDLAVEVQWIAHWPGIELLQLADVVVGGAGYHTVYECAALAVPLVSLPLRRMYDRQAHRAAGLSILVKNPTECVAAVGRILDRVLAKGTGGYLRSHPQFVPQFNYLNGVHEAVQRIGQLRR